MTAEDAAQQVLQCYVQLRAAQRTGCASEYQAALAFYREAAARVENAQQREALKSRPAA